MTHPKYYQHCLVLISISLLLLILPGCREMDQLYGYLQYTGPKLKFSPGKMTMTIGDGQGDIRKAMAKQQYAGEVKKGRVTVFYLEDTRDLGEKTASAYDEVYGLILEKLGVSWSFDLTLKFVDESDVPEGWTYSERLRKNRQLTFPLVVDRRKGSLSTVTAAVVAHEVTEASMFYPEKRKMMLLGDAWLGPIAVPYHTRWLRDGLSDHAANIFSTDVIRDKPVMYPDFNSLSVVKESILKWKNPGEDENYGAALALIYEIAFRYGDEAFIDTFAEISKSGAAGGSELRKAFKKATGIDLREFLSTYQTPWLGLSLVRSSNGELVISRIWNNTPASRWKLKTGDRIMALAEEQVKSVYDYRLALARKKVGDRVKVTIERDGIMYMYNMKTIPYPTDLSLFERSGDYKTGSTGVDLKTTSQQDPPSHIRGSM